MENPYEQVQQSILARIVNNLERLNESVVTLNHELQNINARNKNLQLMGQMCENYHKSVQFNMTATNHKRGPL
ncbi:LAME_0E12728g1_1 [Lachancea meyersii CBS 8951]|uniref:DASH complex subunit DAD4 n=1 Tax=Lachancea meyersii CBS 8951 TaxID=1266667 RepID=A0A1G4JLU9_9SACH|nr:LAME_0E12728g1_1 [Lachancea meyersii CBS 8951]